MNRSNTLRCTRIRLRAQQSWPALSNTAYGAVAAARSRSASANTMFADLPPSSRVTRLTWSAAPRMIRCPTAVEPVKQILRTNGCVTNRSPTTEPWPGSTVSTCSGRPASSASSPSRMAVSGVSSAGLRTTALPAASAGAKPQPAIGIGKFHGTMTPTTPSGSLKVTSSAVGHRDLAAEQPLRRRRCSRPARPGRCPPPSARCPGCGRRRAPRAAPAPRRGRPPPRRTGAAAGRGRPGPGAPRPAAPQRPRSIARSVCSTSTRATVSTSVLGGRVQHVVAGVHARCRHRHSLSNPRKRSQSVTADVEGGQLDVRRVQVVVDDVVTEGRPGHRGGVEQLARGAQRGGHLGLVRRVGVALERRLQLEPVLDAVQPAGQHRGRGQVRVHVAAGQPVLQPQAGAVADDPQRAGAVVPAPGRRRRRERPGREPLVGVDVRRVEAG